MTKNLMRRIRRFFVLRYARSNYRRFVKEADRRHEKYGVHYYVCLDIRDERRLLLLNRKEFRRMRDGYNRMCIRVTVTTGLRPKMNKSTMIEVKDGSFYTTNMTGYDRYVTKEAKERAYRNDMEARRLAYYQYVLDLSEQRPRPPLKARMRRMMLRIRRLAGRRFRKAR